jgi:hypothetical protein
MAAIVKTFYILMTAIMDTLRICGGDYGYLEDLWR